MVNLVKTKGIGKVVVELEEQNLYPIESALTARHLVGLAI
jgi:hypothetical protein